MQYSMPADGMCAAYQIEGFGTSRCGS